MDKTLMFVPEGVSLDVHRVDEKLYLVYVKGCAPTDIRLLRGDVEVKFEELQELDK